MATYADGNAALDYSMAYPAYAPQYEPRTAPETTRPRRGLRVVEGAHVAPREATPISPVAATAIKCASVVAGIAVAAALGKILLVALAFGVASSNSVLDSQLDAARVRGNELEVQQAVYGRSDRIVELATGVYGMVPATESTVMYLDGAGSGTSSVLAGGTLDPVVAGASA